MLVWRHHLLRVRKFLLHCWHFKKVLACVVCGCLKSAFQIASRSEGVADVQYVAHQVFNFLHFYLKALNIFECVNQGFVPKQGGNANYKLLAIESVQGVQLSKSQKSY
ncbi:hypothetical protein Hanom_Chr12g01105771 [Helianthus anomalus]